MSIHHGGGLHVVRERRTGPPAFREEYAIYDDNGRVPDEEANYDPEIGQVYFRGARWILAEKTAQRPFLPYERCFGYSTKSGQPPEQSLRDLGAAMRFTEAASTESDIPSAYTYLGQFVFHDLSYMARGSKDTEPVNKRSAALDLDSLYDDAPGGITFAPCANRPPAALPMGCTIGGEPLDLPRTDTGEPYIGDQRNDDNLALAQTHMALIRFANAVAAAIGNPEEAKRQTQLHFQSLILQDYLARVIDCSVYQDVMNNGRAVIDPSDQPRAADENFLLPLEFAAACGRFGHSMVRSNYEWTSGHSSVDVGALWQNTYNSYLPPIVRLATGWPANWRRLLGVNFGKDDKAIKAATIATRFTRRLANIPAVALPDAEPPGGPQEPNLAVRSLLRGERLELASGQEIAQDVLAMLAAKGRPGFQPLSDTELVANEGTEVREIMNRNGGGEFASLAERTPLWFYVLKEAEVRKGGMRLGALGSRIVMETIHAAIAATCPTILSADGKLGWGPECRLKPVHADKYTYIDAIGFAGLL